MSYKLVESLPIVQRTSASFASRKTQRTPLVRPSPTSSRSYRSLVRCGRLAYHAISNFNSVRMSRYGTRGVFTSLFYADAPTPAAAFEACSATSASMIIPMCNGEPQRTPNPLPPDQVISVIGRKSGRTLSISVWFVWAGEKLYLLPVQGSDMHGVRRSLVEAQAKAAGVPLWDIVNLSHDPLGQLTHSSNIDSVLGLARLSKR